MTKYFIIVPTLLAVAWVASASKPYFEFAGFNIATRIDDIADNYPNSTIAVERNYIWVANEDSHNHIGGIGISRDQNSPRIKLWFEQEGSAEQRHIYPPCRKIFNSLYRRYGGPHVVLNAHAGAAGYQRRVWKHDDERLSLRCFWKDGQKLVEVISIWKER